MVARRLPVSNFAVACLALGIQLGATVVIQATLADDAKLKANMLKAMKKRTDNFKSIDFEWSIDSRVHKRVAFGDEGDAKIAPTDGEFLMFEQTMRLRLDGEMLDLVLSTTDGEKLKRPIGLRSTFDGQLSQEYSGKPPAGSVGSGTVTREKHAFGPRLLYSRPLFVMFRPLSPTLVQADLAAAEFFTKQLAAGAEAVVVLVSKQRDAPIENRFYLDPKQDFVLLRYEEVVSEVVRSQIDVEYATDPKYGPIPTRWICTSFGEDRDFKASYSCAMTHFAINPSIPRDEFRINFPAGTYVDDRIVGKSYYVPGAPNAEKTPKSKAPK